MIAHREIRSGPAGRSIAQLAAAHHGRSEVAQNAATLPDENFPVQRKLQTLANQSERTKPVTLVSPHGRRFAQLEATVNPRR